MESFLGELDEIFEVGFDSAFAQPSKTGSKKKQKLRSLIYITTRNASRLAAPIYMEYSTERYKKRAEDKFGPFSNSDNYCLWVKSNLSRFITLVQAAAKSWTNFCW